MHLDVLTYLQHTLPWFIGQVLTSHSISTLTIASCQHKHLSLPRFSILSKSEQSLIPCKHVPRVQEGKVFWSNGCRQASKAQNKVVSLTARSHTALCKSTAWQEGCCTRLASIALARETQAGLVLGQLGRAGMNLRTWDFDRRSKRPCSKSRAIACKRGGSFPSATCQTAGRRSVSLDTHAPSNAGDLLYQHGLI